LSLYFSKWENKHVVISTGKVPGENQTFPWKISLLILKKSAMKERKSFPSQILGINSCSDENLSQ
jgi:hypothetical protein